MPDIVKPTYPQSSIDLLNRIFLGVLVSCILTGCGARVQTQSNYQKGNYPGLHVRSTANIGQVMVSEYDYLSQESAVVLQDLDGSGWFGRRPVQAGTLLIKTVAGNNEVYCMPPFVHGTACLNDKNGDGRFDRAYTMNAYSAVINRDRIKPIPYRVSDTIAGSGFKYELIYQGTEGNVAKIAYREYSQDLARSAYSQDVSYTIGEGDTEVAFRDLRMIIHRADNNVIEYTVLAGL